MLLQVEVEVMAITVLKDSAERVGVNLKHVVQLDHPRVIQWLVDVVFTQCVSKETNQNLVSNFHNSAAETHFM